MSDLLESQIVGFLMQWLILLYFSPEKKKPRIQGGHVTYKTKNIKQQNRSLNLGKKPMHIKFDSDGNPVDLKPSKTLNKVRNFFGRVEMQSALENDDLDAGPALAYERFNRCYDEIHSDSDELIDSVNETVSANKETEIPGTENKTAINECSKEACKDNKSEDSVKSMAINNQAEQISELKKPDVKSEDQGKSEFRRRRINAKLGIGDISRYFSCDTNSQNDTEYPTNETGNVDDRSSLMTTQQVTVTENINVPISAHGDDLKDVQSISHGIVSNIIDRLLDSVTNADVDSKNTECHDKTKKDNCVPSQAPESKPQSVMTEKEFKESRKTNLVRRKMGLGDLSQYFTDDDNKSEVKAEGKSDSDIKIGESNDDVLDSKSPDLSKEANIQNVHEDDVTSQNKNKTEGNDSNVNGELLNSGEQTDKSLSDVQVKDMRKKQRVRCKLGIGDISHLFANSEASTEGSKTENENAVTLTEDSAGDDASAIEKFKACESKTEPVIEKNKTLTANGEPPVLNSFSVTESETKLENVEKEKLISELSMKQKDLIGGLYNLEEELEIGEKFDPILHSDLYPEDYIDKDAYEAYMAAKKKKKKRRKVAPMPPEIAGDPELRKYWQQRYRLFSKFDEGIQMDKGRKIVLNSK